VNSIKIHRLQFIGLTFRNMILRLGGRSVYRILLGQRGQQLAITSGSKMLRRKRSRCGTRILQLHLQNLIYLVVGEYECVSLTNSFYETASPKVLNRNMLGTSFLGAFRFSLCNADLPSIRSLRSVHLMSVIPDASDIELGSPGQKRNADLGLVVGLLFLRRRAWEYLHIQQAGNLDLPPSSSLIVLEEYSHVKSTYRITHSFFVSIIINSSTPRGTKTPSSIYFNLHQTTCSGFRAVLATRPREEPIHHFHERARKRVIDCAWHACVKLRMWSDRRGTHIRFTRSEVKSLF
jgi:hypothetical protein